MAANSSRDNEASDNANPTPFVPFSDNHTTASSPDVPPATVSDAPPHSEDVEMAEPSDNHPLSFSDFARLHSQRNAANDAVLEPDHPSIVVPQPTMSFPSFSSVLQQSQASTSQPPISNRRARVEDDDDEERDRRHPSQRILSPSSASSTPLGTRQSIAHASDSEQHQQPPRSLPSNPPATPTPRANAAAGNPFRFFHHFLTPTPTTPSPFPASAGPNPPAPTPGPGEPRLPTDFIGGITLTLDFTRGPASPTTSAPDADGNTLPEQPQPIPGFDSPTDTNLPEDGELPSGQSPTLTDLLARIGFFTQMLGAGLGGLQEEREDPERAKKLVEGLEEVPLGLVKRLVQVGGSGGGMGEDESKGGDAGCAICWDNLLLEQDPDSAEPVEQPKIVTLPCAHVFHADCLIPWFSRPKQTTCPSCRFNIDPENLTYVSWRQRRREQRERERNQEQASAPNSAESSASPTTSAPAEPSVPRPASAPASTSATPATASTEENLVPNAQAPPTRERLIPIPIVVPITVPASTLEGLDVPQPPAPGPSTATPTTPNPTRASRQDQPRDFGRLFSRLFGRHTPQTNEPSTPSPSTVPQPGQTNPQPPLPAATPNFGQPRTQFNTFDMGNGTHADVLTIGFDLLLGPPPSAGQTNPRRAVPPFPANLFGAPRAPTADAPAPNTTQPQPDDRHRAFLRQLFGHAPDAPTQATQGPAAPSTPTAAPTDTGGQPTPAAPGANPSPAPQQQPQPRMPPQFLFGGIQFGGGGGAAAPATGDQFMEEFLASLFSGRPPRQGRTQGAQPQPQPQRQSQPTPATGAGVDPVETPSTPPGPTPTAGAAPANDSGATPRGLLDLLSLFGPPIIIAGGPGGAGAPGGIPGIPAGLNDFPPMPPRTERPKRPWTLPPAPGPTLRQRIERREREAGLRCCDTSCGVGPSDEEPELSEIVAAGMKQLSIRSEDGAEVCSHRFHSSCLVSAERVALQGEDAKEDDGHVAVSCPVCRGSGSVLKAEWDEGVASLT